MHGEPRPLRFGNFSAYYGDRTDTFDELLDSGVDVLTGDYLAELTMLVLKKNQMRGGDGFATGFVRQMDRYLPDIAAAGVRLVTNAGGLDPIGCAEAVRDLCRKHGLNLTVAAISGDDLTEQLPSLAAGGEPFRNFDTGDVLDLGETEILTANAYLGAWPIVDALRGGADIVICPRVTDASLVIGPAAHHFGWQPDDFDELAGAMWAGHAIECGGQVTGGNYSFFFEHDDLGIPGMPIAEVYPDGSSVITKATGTGGVVSVDTVTAQLLYEVNSPFYKNPDVIGDLRSLRVEDAGPDRVRISGAVGHRPTSAVKVSLSYEGGYRNSVTVGVTGRRVEEKLAWLRSQVDHVLGDRNSFDSFRWTVIGPADPSGATVADATAWVVITARSRDAGRVGRARFADAIVQLGVSSIPGCYFGGPPQREKLAGVQWPCLLEKKYVDAVVRIGDGTVESSPWPDLSTAGHELDESAEALTGSDAPDMPEPAGATVAVSLGDVFGTRSGDKAGLANLGVWARSDAAYSWLRRYLTVERIKELVPEIADLRVDRYEMTTLRGLNFVVNAYLEMGVATSTSIDNQAKGLGEFLGSRVIEIPVDLTPTRARSEA